MDRRMAGAFLAGWACGEAGRIFGLNPDAGRKDESPTDHAVWEACLRAGERPPAGAEYVAAREVAFDADHVLLGGDRLPLRGVRRAEVVRRLRAVARCSSWLWAGGLLLCATGLPDRSPGLFALGAACLLLAWLLRRHAPQRLDILGAAGGRERSWAVTAGSPAQLRRLRRELLRRVRNWETQLAERRAAAAARLGNVPRNGR